MSGWQYRRTIWQEWLRNKPDSLDDHLAEMADAGWELVSATTTAVGPYNVTHHFFWKKPR
jgi:hypothetical protein